MDVRRAETEADFEKIIDLGHVMHKEGYFRDMPIERKRLQQMAAYTIGNPDIAAAFLAEDKGQIVGMFSGFITHYFFNSEKYAADYAIYTAPNKRGGLAAARLLNSFERWAVSQGAREVIIGLRVSIDNSRALKFFEGMGYGNAVPLISKKVS
jgi:GNAT superfamily N-acetyltransferase